MNERQLTRLFAEKYGPIDQVIADTTEEGSTVVEMFAWIKPMIAILTKANVSKGKYYSVSDYSENEYLELFKNIIGAYRRFLKDKWDMGNLDMSGAIFTYLGDRAGDIASDIKWAMDELGNKNEAEVAREFFKRTNMNPTYHTTPPLLPERIQVDLVIERNGLEYVGNLSNKIIVSAFDFLKIGGYIALFEDNNMSPLVEKALRPGSFELVPFDVPFNYDSITIVRKKA